MSAVHETLAFESEAGRLYYQPTGYARLNWAPGRLSLDLIQVYYEQVLLLLQRTGARRILSEHGQRAPLPPTAQEWITTNWIPRTMRLANTHHCAIVEGVDPIHRLSTQSIVSSAPGDFHFRRFDNFAAAEAWLLSLALVA